MAINKYGKSLGTIILAFLAGVAYRMGGSGNFSRWIREVGVGICLILGFILLGVFNWLSLGCMGTVWIESTYFKKKGTDAKWYNWLLVGLSFSVAILPWFIGDVLSRKAQGLQIRWIGYVIRIIVCTALTVIWQEILSEKVSKALEIGKDITDEMGRGAIQLITLPLVLIG